MVSRFSPRSSLRNHDISFLELFTISTRVSNLGPGWINIGEAYLYVPLSIFRKFTPGAMINFKDQTKRRFLENNRHCLLRHMPIEYQKLFFFGRHNLGNLFEQLEKLAFMGLITFENIQKRQKEQGFTDSERTVSNKIERRLFCMVRRTLIRK